MTKFQFSPNILPKRTNIVFQRKEPIEVKIKKIKRLYRDIPAGMEIKLLRIGIKRHTKIDLAPFSLNTSMEFSILSSFNLNSLPILDLTI